MWVGSQTSQVEIKLSLKACQVSCRRQTHSWILRYSTPVSTSCLSSAGLYPAHALKRRRTPQKTAAGPKGKRAPLLHTMLPRLGGVQNSPLLNWISHTKRRSCICCHVILFKHNHVSAPPRLTRAMIAPQTCRNRSGMNSCRIQVGKHCYRLKEECTDVLYKWKLNSTHIKGFCCYCSSFWVAACSGRPYTGMIAAV